MNAELVKFLRTVERAGVDVTRTRNNHYVLSVAGRHVCGLASSPSDHRWRANTVAKLKRAGIRLGGAS